MPAASPELEETIRIYSGDEEFLRQFQGKIVVEVRVLAADGHLTAYELGRLANTDPTHFRWVLEEYLYGRTDCTFTITFFSPWDGSGVEDCWALEAGEQAIVARGLDGCTATSLIIALPDFVRIAAQVFILSQTLTDPPGTTKYVVERFLARTGIPFELSQTALRPDVPPGAYWDVDWRPETGPRT